MYEAQCSGKRGKRDRAVIFTGKLCMIHGCTGSGKGGYSGGQIGLRLRLVLSPCDQDAHASAADCGAYTARQFRRTPVLDSGAQQADYNHR